MSNPRDFRIPFGKFINHTIEELSESDDGLLYLDWLIGQTWLKDPLKRKLEEFMSDDGVQADLREAMEP